jgi:DNA-directed RNA polymerase specialized sigma54-like protein
MSPWAFAAGYNVSTASNVICIGAAGTLGGENVSNSCFIGNIRDIQTQSADAIPVLIDSHNQLGTQSSSRRFKEKIKPMDETSAAILALKPVTFNYKNDKANRPQFGLIAEEVAAVNPDLVVRDNSGEVYTVRYDAVNAMLLNEFLKEHRKVEKLETTVAQQQTSMEALADQLKQQAAHIQKISAQIEISKGTPKVVVNQP